MSPGSGPSDAAVEEAAQWFARLNSRSVSTDSLHAFRAWRRSPENDEAYLAVEKVWRETAKLERDPAIQDVVAETIIRSEPQTRRRRAGVRWGQAAGFAVVLIIAAVLLVAVRAATLRQTFATTVGEQHLFTLTDGSRVRLDTDTKIAVRFASNLRQVELLKGQVFFDVAHDPSRPFIVSAGTTQVRAVGTQFDVRKDDEQVRVSLVQGVVKVTSPTASGAVRHWTLAAGDRLTASPATQSLQETSLDTDTSWVAGQLIFKNIPLADAIAEVNRYNRGQIILDAPSVASVRVNGTFQSADPGDFVSAVSGLYGLRASTRSDGAVVLSPAAKPPEGAS